MKDRPKQTCADVYGCDFAKTGECIGLTYIDTEVQAIEGMTPTPTEQQEIARRENWENSRKRYDKMRGLCKDPKPFDAAFDDLQKKVQKIF